MHTPGPWHVHPSEPDDTAHVFAADPLGSNADGDIVTIADFISDGDARLIAAAPDMLAALKAVDVIFDAVALATCDGVELLGPKVREVLETSLAVRAAIAKAEAV